MALEPVSDWRQAYRWASAWGLTALASLPAAYEFFDSIKAILSPEQMHRGMIILAALTLVARITNQTPKGRNEPADTDKTHP